MSRFVILFPLGDYTSKSDGTARMYLIDERLWEVLAQAKTILVHHRVEEKSTNNAGAKLHFSHASLDGSPTDVAVAYGDLDLATENNEIQTVDGPFASRVFVKLEVVDTSEPPATQKAYRMEIGATLIMD
jgi:hypothetical protein